VDKKEFRIVYFGTPSMSAKVLERLFSTGYNVVGLVAREDKPIGRKGIIVPVPTKLVAFVAWNCHPSTTLSKGRLCADQGYETRHIIDFRLWANNSLKQSSICLVFILSISTDRSYLNIEELHRYKAQF
jgi:hypothetical protein